MKYPNFHRAACQLLLLCSLTTAAGATPRTVPLLSPPRFAERCIDAGYFQGAKAPFHLVLGLGNRGSEFETSRHSLGYMAIDYIVKQSQAQQIFRGSFPIRSEIGLRDSQFYRRHKRGHIQTAGGRSFWHGQLDTQVFRSPLETLQRTVFAKPSSEINFSGNFFDHLDASVLKQISEVTIIYDDLSVATGSIQLKGAAELTNVGHNGVRSILAKAKNLAITFRGIAIGIKPDLGAPIRNMEKYLIGPISRAERATLLGTFPTVMNEILD